LEVIVMSKIILDTELRAKLNGLNQPLEFCDADGHTVGHFLPVAEYRKLLYAAVEAACPHSPEERERRRHETGGITLKEFWKRMGVA
jgi:hypothetical protein